MSKYKTKISTWDKTKQFEQDLQILKKFSIREDGQTNTYEHAKDWITIHYDERGFGYIIINITDDKVLESQVLQLVRKYEG